MHSLNAVKRLANILAISAFVAGAFMCCKKTPGNNTLPEIFSVSASLKENFAFHLGSYWIYRDSLTGDIDSAYVDYYKDSLYHVGCVASPLREYVYMTIRRSSITHGVAAGADRAWMLTLSDSIIKMRGVDDQDSIAGLQFLTLAKYPFATGFYYGSSGGCLLFGFVDSGYVTGIVPSLAINGSVYANTAISQHTNMAEGGVAGAYNDVMYLAPRVGLVRADIDHSLHAPRRVWVLQRYHIEHL